MTMDREEDCIYCPGVGTALGRENLFCPDCPLCLGEGDQCSYHLKDELQYDRVGFFPDLPLDCRAVSEWGLKEEERELLQRALKYAAWAHREGRRKGTDIPYIIHPLEVTGLVATMTRDVTVLAAAALHDVVEDTYREVEDIAAEFGEAVARLVDMESEDKMRQMSPADSWKIRKRHALEHMANLPVEAKMICMGDKLSNLRMTFRSHLAKGKDMWMVFNMKDETQQAWYYRSIGKALEEFGDTEIWKEYMRLCDIIFEGVESAE